MHQVVCFEQQKIGDFTLFMDKQSYKLMHENCYAAAIDLMMKVFQHHVRDVLNPSGPGCAARRI